MRENWIEKMDGLFTAFIICLAGIAVFVLLIQRFHG